MPFGTYIFLQTSFAINLKFTKDFKESSKLNFDRHFFFKIFFLQIFFLQIFFLQIQLLLEKYNRNGQGILAATGMNRLSIQLSHDHAGRARHAWATGLQAAGQMVQELNIFTVGTRALL